MARDHEEMQCAVDRIDYDFGKRLGRAYLEHGDCVDMDGCIAVFVRIDSEVRRIETFSGNAPDTAYSRRRDGEWEAEVQP